jgi:hypothetical protein
MEQTTRTLAMILAQPQAQPVDEIPLPEGVTSLHFMQAIYRDPRQPMQRRIRAAQAALPFEHPKLSATYAVDGSRDFAAEMKEIARRSGRSNVLDAKADYHPAIEASPQPVPQLTEAGRCCRQGRASQGESSPWER